MKYFFELGNHPELSLMEIKAIFGQDIDLLSFKIAALEFPELDAQKAIMRMGGSIKIGKVIGNLSGFDLKNIIGLVEKHLHFDAKHKHFFGISYYGRTNHNIKMLGMQIKRMFNDRNISARWVISQAKALSSVVVTQNKLIEKGFELCIMENDRDRSLTLGLTMAVQPFKNMSFRDYSRPARDDLSGMIPPKLAQIMLNLATQDKNTTIMDPFCGSGTIIMEALIAGYERIIANDLSPKAVADTKKNLAWLNQVSSIEYPISAVQYHNMDASLLSSALKPASVDTIITEPYLGPQRGKIAAKKVITELESLYSKSLKEFYKILKPRGRVVMVWPMIFDGRRHLPLNPIYPGFKIVNPLEEHFFHDKRIHFTSRRTAVYKREDQKVWREITILQKG